MRSPKSPIWASVAPPPAFARWSASRFCCRCRRSRSFRAQAAARLVERRQRAETGRRAAIVRRAIFRARDADFSASAEPGTRPLDRRRRALAGRCHRSGTRGAGGNRQHHPECLPGHDRECPAPHDADVAAVRGAGRWRRRCSMFSRRPQAQPGAVSLHRLHHQESRHSRLHRLADGPAVDYRAEENRATTSSTAIERQACWHAG